MPDDISFWLANERAIHECEKHYLDCDDFEDHDDCPYDTTEEDYD